MDEIIEPTVRALARARHALSRACCIAGLMITEDGPKLIEYNVRFGDPECQVLMMRLKSDLLPALIAARDGLLKNFDLRWYDDAALTVVMAAKGYPGQLRKRHADRRARRGRASRRRGDFSCRHDSRRRHASSPRAGACSTSRARGKTVARGAAARLRRPSTASTGPTAFAAATSAGARFARDLKQGIEWPKIAYRESKTYRQAKRAWIQ